MKHEDQIRNFPQKYPKFCIHETSGVKLLGTSLSIAISLSQTFDSCRNEIELWMKYIFHS